MIITRSRDGVGRNPPIQTADVAYMFVAVVVQMLVVVVARMNSGTLVRQI